jgi:ferredoxin
MNIATQGDRVYAARRKALELLLSEHVGDCEAPCRRACPAHMDIPRMIRRIRDGRLEQAAATVLEHIALPAVLGRICPAPCEKACKRRFIDEPVAVCLLKRYAADEALAGGGVEPGAVPGSTGRSIAVVGAGPAGLAAAYYLARRGHAVRIFDRNPEPGGQLRYGVPEKDLPGSILDAEIARIERLGVEFSMSRVLGRDVQPEELKNRYDAVILATGTTDPAWWGGWGFRRTARGLAVERDTFATNRSGFFAAGNVVSPSRMAVRAVAQGKGAADSVHGVLGAAPPPPADRRSISSMAGMLEGETGEFLKEAAPGGRLGVAAGAGRGYDRDEAVREARRCLGCDCRKADTCRLRALAEDYQAIALGFPGESRRPLRKIVQHDRLIYEPGKCIRCGLCVRITEAASEPLGLAFVGRGFDVRVEPPFGESMHKALIETVETCVEACPTAALSWRDHERF